MKTLPRLALLAAFFVANADHALAWDSPAPDVVLYCTPALQGPLSEVAALYRAASHVEVHILSGSPGGQAALIRHRARADVLVAETPTVTALDADHLIRPGTIAALGADPFVLIGRTGSAPASAADLIATHTVALTDPTSAASFDGAAVLRAALPNAAAPHVLGVADTPTIIALVKADASLLGVVNRTEAGESGLNLAAPPVSISGALLSNGQSRNAAALLAFIAGPQGRAILSRAGLENAS